MQAVDISDVRERIWLGSTRREDLVQRVTLSLRDLILSGRLPLGTKLMPEAELARQLSVSRPSLREAIRILAHEGLIDVRHGVGSFVSSGRAKMVGSLELMRSMTDLIRQVGGVPSCATLSISHAEPDAQVRAALELPKGVRVAHIARVRLIDGRPCVQANEYLTLDETGRRFDAVARFDGSSLYRFMREDLRITISHSSSRLAAVSADTTLAQRLEMPRRAPLLLMSEIHFDISGRPVLYSVNHHNSQVVNFTSMRWGMPL